MDTPIAVAIISASAAVIVPAITLYFTKQKEREADWRKHKLEQYREFMSALGAIVGSDSTPDGNRRFALACNTLHLTASQPVINALHAFQDEIRESNLHKSTEEHDKLLSRLVWAIRKDLNIPETPGPDDFSATLWCSGANDGRRLQPPSLPHPR